MNNIELINLKTERYYAFIDETGNSSLEVDKQGNTSHFIITAIIIPENKVAEIEKRFDEIRERYVGKGELKSSKLRKNPKRRIEILKELDELEYTSITLVVDKSKIIKDSGLRFKKSFYKNLNNKLYNELRLSFPMLTMIADEFGRDEYMQSFRNYVEERNELTLFDDNDFDFSNSKSKVLIQLADLVAGSISYNYEIDKIKLNHYKDFKGLIEAKSISIIEWPVELEQYIHEYERLNEGKFDKKIYIHSLRIAIDYLNKHESSDEQDVRECVIVLRYLMSKLLSDDTDRYVTSYELIRNLNKFTMRDYKPHYFKTKIIAKLRDSDILIASSSKGYKIPESEEELIRFVNHTNSMIQPMLARIQKARLRVKRATNGELDILDKEAFRKLKNMIDD